MRYGMAQPNLVAVVMTGRSASPFRAEHVGRAGEERPTATRARAKSRRARWRTVLTVELGELFRPL